MTGRSRTKRSRAPHNRQHKGKVHQAYEGERDLQRQGVPATDKAVVKLPDGPIVDRIVDHDTLITGRMDWKASHSGGGSFTGWFAIGKGDDGRITPLGIALVILGVSSFFVFGGVILAATRPGAAVAVFAMAVLCVASAVALAWRAQNVPRTEAAKQVTAEVDRNEAVAKSPVNEITPKNMIDPEPRRPYERNPDGVRRIVRDGGEAPQ